jgi:hypothetical protein
MCHYFHIARHRGSQPAGKGRVPNPKTRADLAVWPLRRCSGSDPTSRQKSRLLCRHVRLSRHRGPFHPPGGVFWPTIIRWPRPRTWIVTHGKVKVMILHAVKMRSSAFRTAVPGASGWAASLTLAVSGAVSGRGGWVGEMPGSQTKAWSALTRQPRPCPEPLPITVGYSLG